MTKQEIVGASNKQAVLCDWVRRRLGSVAHELRVARVAKMLFELTHRWHGLQSGERRLLMMGALVHDVGRAFGEKKHAQRGAEMILEHDGLPLADAERRRLAYLTRYHRGAVPEAGEEEILEQGWRGRVGEGEDDSFAMRVLLGILRTADALDSRSIGGPRLTMTIRGRLLMINGYVEGNAEEAREKYGRPKKFRLMEEMLACEVRPVWMGRDENGHFANGNSMRF